MSPKSPSAASPLDEWLRWQEAQHAQPIALGLDRIRPVAHKLGLPAAGVHTVTVAGTNGKGSTTVLLAEIYRAAGYRTGTYTSPHLRRYNERVAVDGRALDDAALCRAFAEVEAARDGAPLTYFEFGTLAALWLFREAAVQVQLLEVGMGGRLDAVNLVDADCAVVTNIGLDHREFLGADRERIGFEKAGVFRRGRPAVCVDPDPPASVARHATEIGAPLWQLHRDFDYRPVADTWHWRGPGSGYRKLPPPALAGAAQMRNAAGALAAITALQARLPVTEAAIRAGLVRLHLPGRFERRAAGGCETILDVAHNAEAAQVLADNLRAIAANRPVHVVLGMLSDKPVEQVGAALAGAAVRFYAAGLPPPRGLTAAALAARLRGTGQPVAGFATVAEAYGRARAEARPGDIILVCGSFLTVAAAEDLLDG